VAVRSLGAALAVAALGLALAGCGGGGGGGSGGGSGGGAVLNNPPPVAAKPGNALLQHVSGSKIGGVSVDGQSPARGSTVSIASAGAWTKTTIGPNPPADLPISVKSDYLSTPVGYNLYQRSVTINVTGGTGGLGASSVSGTEYVTCATVPGANGCGDAKVYFWTRAVTQDAALQVITVTPNGQTGTKRTTTLNQMNSLTELTGQGALANSYVGQYSDSTLTGLLIGGDVTTNSATSATLTSGWFFGGDATPATDMTALKAAPSPSATYNGAFLGNTGTITTTNDIYGDVAITVDFGAGSVNGNVTNMRTLPSVGPSSPSGYGLVMNGTIVGAGYSGSTTYSDGTGTGQVVGGFFGPNASETAGVVQVQGAQPVGGSCVSADCVLQGAFGAKKN
jgi:hypothetical protein